VQVSAAVQHKRADKACTSNVHVAGQPCFPFADQILANKLRQSFERPAAMLAICRRYDAQQEAQALAWARAANKKRTCVMSRKTEAARLTAITT